MPFPAEFEEKEYEIPLYLELYDHAPLWSPGQVLEARLGVDAALRTESRLLWRRLGYAQPLRGFALNRAGRRFTRNRPLPNFEANLLLQVKRPIELRRRPNGVTAAHLPGTKPYWRFEIRERQHLVLCRLAARVSNRALVAYASPAFADLNTLYDCIDNRLLIDNSTFIRVSRLEKHGRWVYNIGGTSGVGCSDPERIVDPPLRDQLDVLRVRAAEEPGEVQPLTELAGTIERVVASEVRGEDPRARTVLKRFREIDEVSNPYTDEAIAESPARMFLNPFAKIHTFTQVYGSNGLSLLLEVS